MWQLGGPGLPPDRAKYRHLGYLVTLREAAKMLPGNFWNDLNCPHNKMALKQIFKQF